MMFWDVDCRGSVILTVKRSTPLRKFFCVPAKRHRMVIINEMNTVTVGKVAL
jgi:hypothetical protein